MRPALLLATCEAFGGAEQDAWSVAVSIELLHNAFLVHDDIEDGSDLVADLRAGLDAALALR